MNADQSQPIAARLTRVYAFPGARAADLQAVLEACAWRQLGPGKQLCEENDKGDTLFILAQGSVDVFKKDRRGQERKLVTVEAPTLLGHMSLIDRSPRSATCITATPCQVGVMDAETFDRLRAEQSPAGTAFRRLLLASLNQQLRRGDAQLEGLLRGAEPVVEKAEEALLHTMGTLDGWQADEATETVPYEGDDWKKEIHQEASALVLGAGATLRPQLDAPVPLLLELEGLSPEASERVLKRFVRFVYSIPTPPALSVQFRNCPSGLLPRPRTLERLMRLYFPAGSFAAAGDERSVTVRFSNLDARWLARPPA